MITLHPMPEQLPLYWELFKENADPIVKVLHVPTIEPVILDSKEHLENIPKGLEVLLFSIYYCVVTSLSTEECRQQMEEEKSVLLTRYRFAVEQALARAHFLASEELIVLQGFVIFLFCLRRNDAARVIWTLTGLVVRIAQTMGLHRDGTHFGLSPFETEMRRRLWWQISVLDARASEDHGCDPTVTEGGFDTKMPLNVNDSDLGPAMKELPKEQDGPTDMTFGLIRFEVLAVFRRLIYVPPAPLRCSIMFATASLEKKEKWIAGCQERLEERYLRHCDMTVPLDWVIATIARLIMAKLWLMLYHPFQRMNGGAGLSQEVRDKLFVTSLESIEYSLLLEREHRTAKWGWLFRTYVQWHAFAFLLSELCVRTQGVAVDRAWRAVEAEQQAHRRREDPVANGKDGQLWKPLGKLMAKAKTARATALAERQQARCSDACADALLPDDGGAFADEQFVDVRVDDAQFGLMDPAARLHESQLDLADALQQAAPHYGYVGQEHDAGGNWPSVDSGADSMAQLFGENGQDWAQLDELLADPGMQVDPAEGDGHRYEQGYPGMRGWW